MVRVIEIIEQANGDLTATGTVRIPQLRIAGPTVGSRIGHTGSAQAAITKAATAHLVFSALEVAIAEPLCRAQRIQPAVAVATAGLNAKLLWAADLSRRAVAVLATGITGGFKALAQLHIADLATDAILVAATTAHGLTTAQRVAILPVPAAAVVDAAAFTIGSAKSPFHTRRVAIGIRPAAIGWISGLGCAGGEPHHEKKKE